MDKIFVKAINDAGYRETEWPDWVFYQTGQFGKPEFIIHEGNMREIIEEYCKLHKINIDLNSGKK